MPVDRLVPPDPEEGLLGHPSPRESDRHWLTRRALHHVDYRGGRPRSHDTRRFRELSHPWTPNRPSWLRCMGNSPG